MIAADSRFVRARIRSTCTPRSFLVALATLVLAIGFFAMVPSARAERVVVSPDGLHDFTSIQTAIDSLWARRAGAGMYGPPDTAVVMPAYYDERIETYDNGHTTVLVLLCPDGPLATRVRAVGYPADGGYSRHDAEVFGLGIVEKVSTSARPATYWFRNCRFEGGYDMSAMLSGVDGYAGGTLRNCEFLDTTMIVLPDYGADTSVVLRGLTFRGGRHWIRTGCTGEGALMDCNFEGPADTLVTARAQCNLNVNFIRCTFQGAAVALAKSPFGSGIDGYANRVVVRECRFEDIDDAAIVADIGTLPRRPPGIEVWNSRFVQCGRAVDWRAGAGSVVMVSDTIQTLSTPALRLDTGFASLHGLVFESGSGGVEARVDSRPNGPMPGVETPGSLTIRDCTFSGTIGTAIDVTDTLVSPRTAVLEITRNTIRDASGGGIRVRAPRATIRGNTVVECEGDGVAITPLDPLEGFVVDSNTVARNEGDGIRLSEPWYLGSRVFQHNLVARNDGAGLRVGSPVVGSVAFNAAWQNYLGDYAQVESPLDSNLVVDPLFCDAAGGDFSLQFGSPCGSGGVYGLIGALPETCPTIVGATPHVAGRSFAIHPNPARGEVTFTLPPGAGGGTVEVLDVTGRRVWSRAFSGGSEIVRWRGESPQGAARAGLYWVRLAGASEPSARRLVWLK